eukprot:g406.t1
MGAGVPLDGTSASIVVIVLLSYVVISTLVEIFLHHIHHYIEHSKNKAFMNVFEKVKDEIMLVGVLTIALLATEQYISEEICMDSWCHGIPNTQPSCDAKYDKYTSSSGNSSSSSSSSSRRMLLGASSSGSAPTCYRFDNCCNRGTGFPSSCPSGQQNFISINALHQIHYYILYLMLCHIFMTVFVMYGANLRVLSWGKFENDNSNTKMAPRSDGGTMRKMLCSCQRQFHENVDSFTYVAIRNYFIARNKEKVNAEMKVTGKDFNFFNELKQDVENEYMDLTGVSSWMWLVLSAQTIVKAYVMDLPWGTFVSIILIMVVGSKLDRIKNKITGQIFEIADNDGNGIMDKAEFEELKKVDGRILDRLKEVEPEFWMHNPDLVLFMIRMVIWLNATEIGTTLFYIVDSLDNCYVLRRGWIWISVGTSLTLLVAIHCSINVIPLYSLTSNLGSHQTPREVTMALFVPKKLATLGGIGKSSHEKSKVRPASEVTSAKNH